MYKNFLLVLFLFNILKCFDNCSNLKPKSEKNCFIFSDSNFNCCFNIKENKCILFSRNQKKTNNNILCYKKHSNKKGLINEFKSRNVKFNSTDNKNNIFSFQKQKQNENKEYIDEVILNCNYSNFLKIKILLIHLFILFVVLM